MVYNSSLARTWGLRLPLRRCKASRLKLEMKAGIDVPAKEKENKVNKTKKKSKSRRSSPRWGRQGLALPRSMCRHWSQGLDSRERFCGTWAAKSKSHQPCPPLSGKGSCLFFSFATFFTYSRVALSLFSLPSSGPCKTPSQPTFLRSPEPQRHTQKSLLKPEQRTGTVCTSGCEVPSLPPESVQWQCR
jgi:hypothetical protein